MNAMIQFANGGALELESWVSQTLARSVALNLNNVQLASGGPVERAYSGAGSDVIQGAAQHDSLKGDSDLWTVAGTGASSPLTAAMTKTTWA